MILEYKVNNFASFNGDVHFHMKPKRAIERFEDNYVQINSGLKILKVAVIVGENGGGKTNFIRSLHYLKHLFNSNSNEIHLYRNLCFKFDVEKIQSFELTVLCENKKIYTYELKIDKYSIVFEGLHVRNENQTEKSNKVIFFKKRTGCKFEQLENDLNEGEVKTQYEIDIEDKFINNDLKKILNANIYTEKNAIRGLLVNYLSLIGVDIVKFFVDWVKEYLIVEIPENGPLSLYKQFEKEEKDIEIMRTELFFEIFSLVDSSIVDIKIDEEKPYIDTIIVRKNSSNNKFEIKLKNESSGIVDFFAWSLQLWKVTNNNAVLFADEIDRVLNPILSSKITNYIQNTEHQGQFIFTTHNIFQLNTNDYMKEQLYFITKDKETLGSEMYSLDDFKNYRYDKSDVYDLYLRGILGGVPND